MFEKLGVGLQSKQDLQVCEDLHKSPLHEGLQPATPVGIENIGNEVDGVQINEAAMALNQTHRMMARTAILVQAEQVGE